MINLNLYAKYLKEKDNNTNLELEIDFQMIVINLIINLLRLLEVKMIRIIKVVLQKRLKAMIKRRLSTHNIVTYNGMQIKVKQYYSLQFLHYAEIYDKGDVSF